MTKSLKAVNFDYTDESRWRPYFDSTIRKFAELAWIIDEFRSELNQKCDDMPFDELQEEWDYSQVLLGGVDEDGEYRERSLARLYNDLIGLQFENLKEVVEKQKQGISPTTKVKVLDTPFSDFVSEALERSEDILRIAEEKDIIYDGRVDTEYDFYDILSDQEKFTQLLTDFVRKVQRLLPNYNEKALFVWSLDNSTGRYLSVAYPKLKDRDTWRWLDELFGLEPIFIPEIEETGEKVQKRKQQYTVYGYRDGSLGNELTDLYGLVWQSFDNEVQDLLRLVFTEVPNFKKEFLKQAHSKLDQINWAFPEEIRTVSQNESYSGTRGDTTQAEYHISGVTIDSYTYSGYATSNNYYPPETRECELSLLKVLDDFMPGLFLLNGLEYRLDIDSESLEVEEL